MDFERLGIEPRRILDFSVNVASCPSELEKIWPQLLQDVTQYPSSQGCGVKRYYQARFGLAPESILPGNGSIDLIYAVPRILGLKRVLIPQPAFSDYSRACTAAGAEVVHGNLDELEDCDALFVGNPNNPNGKLIPAEVLLELADHFPHTTFLVDEAFIQFVETPEHFSLLSSNRLRRNIILLHSLTKFHGLPGLRLGAAISTPETITRFEQQRPPWMISRPAERVAEALITLEEHDRELAHRIHKERERVFEHITALPAFNPLPGAANFLLIQWQGSDNLDDLMRHLMQHGIYVRDCRNFPTLEQNWFRIAIRSPEENEQLLNLLEAL